MVVINCNRTQGVIFESFQFVTERMCWDPSISITALLTPPCAKVFYVCICPSSCSSHGSFSQLLFIVCFVCVCFMYVFCVCVLCV